MSDDRPAIDRGFQGPLQGLGQPAPGIKVDVSASVNEALVERIEALERNNRNLQSSRDRLRAEFDELWRKEENDARLLADSREEAAAWRERAERRMQLLRIQAMVIAESGR